MSEPKRTIELNIPRTAEERVKATSEWHCAGCGVLVPDLVKRCDCATMVACKEGFTSVWMADQFQEEVAEIGEEQPELDRLRARVTELEREVATWKRQQEDSAAIIDGLHKTLAQACRAENEACAQIAEKLEVQDDFGFWSRPTPAEIAAAKAAESRADALQARVERLEKALRAMVDATRMVVVASSVRSEVRAALAADGENNDCD